MTVLPIAPVFTQFTLADDRHKRHSLLKATFVTFLPSFFTVALSRLAVSAFTFGQPLLINSTLNFVSKDRSSDDSGGRGLIGAWALVYLGIAVSLGTLVMHRIIQYS